MPRLLYYISYTCFYSALIDFYINLDYDWAIGLMSRVFVSGLGDQGSIPGRVIPKTQKNGT